MGDPTTATTRLQRLQRQRQRANQRNSNANAAASRSSSSSSAAASSPSSSPSVVAKKSLVTTNARTQQQQQQQAIEGQKRTTTPAAAVAPNNNNSNSNSFTRKPPSGRIISSGGNSYTATTKGATKMMMMASNKNIDNKKLSAAADNSDSTQKLTSSSRRAAAVGKKILQQQQQKYSSSNNSISSRIVMEDSDNESVEVVEWPEDSSPSSRVVPAPQSVLRSGVPQTPQKTYSPKASSPKSLAVSKSIAESRHRLVRRNSSVGSRNSSVGSSAGSGIGSASASTSSSSSSKDWFQYTNGTPSKSNLSYKKQPSSQRSEKPRTMEELQFFNDHYAPTPRRGNGGEGGVSANKYSREARGDGIYGRQASDAHDEISTLSGTAVNSTVGNNSLESSSAGLRVVQATEATKQRTWGQSARKSVSPSQCSIPSDEEMTHPSSEGNASEDASSRGTASTADDSGPKRNMWKEMSRVNKSDQNRFNSSHAKNYASANSYNNSNNKNNNDNKSIQNNTNDNLTPPWARRNSEQKYLGKDNINSNGSISSPPWASRGSNATKSRIGAPSRPQSSSKLGQEASYLGNNKFVEEQRRQNMHKPTKQKLLSKPVDKVGDAVELPSSPKKNDKNLNKKSDKHKSISVRHGGTAVWIHASVLEENKADFDDEEWEWVRGYLHGGGDESDESMEVTIDDAHSSLDRNSYTISKKYNDGAHILMGNAWWSTQQQPPSPSPTSISHNLSSSEALLTHTLSHEGDTPGMPPGDLVEMTHLHEPAIVHALRTRYERDIIYTNTGAILLALNPFKKLDHLYTREMMELYWSELDDRGKNGGSEGGGDNEGCGEDSRPPHAYAVAEQAYSSMLRSLEERDAVAGHSKGGRNGEGTTTSSLCNQSILVSGESGAGKTVTTKIIMRYLSILSQRHSDDGNGSSNKDGMDNGNPHGGPSVEMQVLQSNPILESFGNARTIRNDNSSRFGKFIEMSFCASDTHSSGKRGSLLGATIDFYLLEKVRLVSVNPGERNYHIFYEVLASRRGGGMGMDERKRYMLTQYFGESTSPCTVRDFKMTSVSGTFDRRDGVDDADTYGELRTAMDTVGFTAEEQDGIFRLVSALLHASNLRFTNDGGEDFALVYDRDGTSDAVSNLLGVSEECLIMALTTSLLEARGEVLTKRLSIHQAEKALEATVKAAYGALFAYIVGRINRSIRVHGDFGHDVADGTAATIGVLDIFGFESFETNSFEQLCINYCNEALQQQFNRYVFKAEQAEYEREGIEWSNITFPDNQEALDLIEMKRVGIFAVLDEQCRLPRRTDRTFAEAVYNECEANAHFAASRMQRSKGRFAVVHYAGEVEYDSESFLLKNKDELPKGATELLASSSAPIISELANILNGGNSGDGDRVPLKRSSSALTRSTVSGQFSSQLKGLRARIGSTEPHYIRCLKPNDCLVPNLFDASLIAHQLNCAGVLPAMKIARAGFAMRYLHSAFVQRYRPVVYKELSQRTRRISGHQLTCQFLISLLLDRLEGEMRRKTQTDSAKTEDVENIVSWGVQVGKTKVFLRTAAFEALEELRNSTMNVAAIALQARTRAFLCQNKFYLILGSVLTLQCAARKLIASLYVRRLRFTERSITIQKHWRSYSSWCRYQTILFVAAWCQRFWRGKKVRERYITIKQYRCAIVIQCAWRSYVFRLCHKQMRNAAITIQCFYRVCVSSSMLRQLKREAKDVQSIAMERDKLRMEMRRMKRELELAKNLRMDNNGRNTIQQSDSFSTAPTNASQEERIRQLSQECAKKDHELRALRQEVESLRGSGRSVPSTLPLTVTVDTALQSFGRPASPSPLGLSRLASGESSLSKSMGLGPASPSLLDAEVEDSLPQLECSQISSLPDSSLDITDDRVDMSMMLDRMAESSFIDCIKIDELPFHQAVQNNDKHLLLLEIQNSSDIELGINSADSKGRTPLHIAVQCSNLDFVRILLSHDAVPNTQDFTGNTALHYADSPEMTQVLLEGGISPNIPNGDGLCFLHLAVKRRDFISIKHLLLHGADVNNADDQYWYTSLHLVAHAESPLTNASRSLRGPIAELLCEAKAPSAPDLNYQDRDGNSPLHHAASLVEEDAGILISLFLEHGSCPKITNNRGQTPIHLFCHNHGARQFVFYHEALHLMLVKGADPNTTSLSGCTALHLALYHKDVAAAALLVRHGAQVNMKWKKPQKWEASWTDMGSDDVLPLDMLEDMESLHTVLAEISTPQLPASRRPRCMHCKSKFGMFARHHNCTHCGRSVCGKCCIGSLGRLYFPTLKKEDGNGGMFKVCSLCEPILLSKIDRVPTTIVSSGGCDQSSIGTISM